MIVLRALATLALLAACGPVVHQRPADAGHEPTGYRLVGVADGCQVWRDEAGAVVITDAPATRCAASAAPGAIGADAVWRREAGR